MQWSLKWMTQLEQRKLSPNWKQLQCQVLQARQSSFSQTRLIIDPQILFQNFRNGYTDHKGPENITHIIHKYGETFYVTQTALKPAVVKIYRFIKKGPLRATNNSQSLKSANSEVLSAGNFICTIIYIYIYWVRGTITLRIQANWKHWALRICGTKMKIHFFIRIGTCTFVMRWQINFMNIIIGKNTFWHTCPTNQPAHPSSLIRVFVVRINKLEHWLSYLHPMNILIRFRECAGWSESSLSSYVRRYVFWCCNPFILRW